MYSFFKRIISKKKWIYAYFALSLLLMLVVAFFNYYIDSAGVFHSNKALRSAAISLLQQKMVAGLNDYDEREFQKLIIENSHRKIDMVVLGSSRTIQLRKVYLNINDGTNFFNHSVSGASMEDYFSIMGIYESRGYLPKVIIIGLDPWVFNRNNRQYRWKSLSPYYELMLEKILGGQSKVEVNRLDKYRQLINWDYTVGNLKFFKNKGRFYTVDRTDIDDSIRQSDGSLDYPYSIRLRSDDETRRLAKNYVNQPVYSLEDFYELSYTEIFERFIGYLKKKKGVEIIFFLPPYHPITYTFLANDPRYRILKDVENYINKLAKGNGILLIGSYDPEKYRFLNCDFFDGMHPKDKTIKAIFKNYSEYGHKVFSSGGRSTIILGRLIESGNPADCNRYRPLLEQHRQ